MALLARFYRSSCSETNWTLSSYFSRSMKYSLDISLSSLMHVGLCPLSLIFWNKLRNAFYRVEVTWSLIGSLKKGISVIITHYHYAIIAWFGSDGEFLVWSVHIKLDKGMIFVCNSSTGGSGLSWTLAARAVADLIPCLFLYKCSKMVGNSNGKCFKTNSLVNPGSVVKLPLSIALSHIL